MSGSPTYGSLFAGIGGFCLGMEQAGMRCSWRVEIDSNCCRVLSRHWPMDHLHKDVRDFSATGTVQRPDVITFGSPCQDVSVAGRRAGLAGERSGLFYEACRILGEFQPKAFVFENVPGLLTSNRGRDMGAVVGSLADLGFGLAWRVLDAQWFGLAQRRKRLIIVGVAGGDARRAGEILLEPESVCGDSAPSRPSREVLARCITASVGGVSAKEQQHTFVGRDGEPLNGLDRDGSAAGPRAAVSCEEVADPICTREGKTWTCEGSNNFRARNLVGVPYAKSKRACSATDHETWVEAEVAPTQNQFDQGDARATTVVGTWRDGGDVSQTLDTVVAKQQAMPEKQRFPAVLQGSAVRRLMPIECERLQGFPDGWTATGGDGKPLSDSARYRALGNAVAVPVAAWVARRIVASGALGKGSDR